MKISMTGFWPILTGFALLPIILFGGLAIWKTNTYEDAISILNRLNTKHQAEIVARCSDLMANHETYKHVIERSPFDFMQIDFIRLSHKTCEVFLFKGPYKGVGYIVKKQLDNTNQLLWFNDFESWDRHPITLL